MAEIRNKIVVITGACGGLGKALSRSFGQRGNRIVGVDVHKETLLSFSEELQKENISFTGYECDITCWTAVQETGKKILEEVGRPDILINNAGISHLSLFENTQIAVLSKVMDVNFLGSVHWSKVLLPSLLESKGMIIVLSSVAGFSPLLGRTAYSASKHALHGFFESLRTEVASRGVSVLMVSPAFVATNINQNALGGDGSGAKQERLHMGKKMAPEYVAEKIFHAASQKKKFICVGRIAHLSYWVQKFFPSLYEYFMVKKFKKEVDLS